MPTQCSQDSLDFGTVEGRQVVASFDGGSITSDAGALLLGATDKAIGLVERFAACFIDARSPELIEHSLETLVGQRLFGLALGYEDLNDHDQLRNDPVMAVLAGKLASRRQGCAPVAGKSTLNRLEQALRGGVGRYHRIGHDDTAIEALFVALFLDAHTKPPKRIILDLDATDDPLHGHQEGRFFHGYYDCYCYLPLYITCGRHLIAAKLRRADIDASAGATEEVARIVAQVRARWPKVEIIIRADSGFARDQLMSWCEENRVEYVLGLARNGRLVANIKHEMVEARAEARETNAPARRFKDFAWTTRDSWSRERRVIAKAEWTSGKANPRFVVTSLKKRDASARFLYEKVYCARGDPGLRRGRLWRTASRNARPTCSPTARPPRRCARTNCGSGFASMAYVLMCALRRIGLAGTELAQATCGTIRLELLKIGARVTVSARRVKLALASACPSRQIFAVAAGRLRRIIAQAPSRQAAA